MARQNPVLDAINGLGRNPYLQQSAAMFGAAGSSFAQGASLALKLDALLTNEEQRLQNNVMKSQQMLETAINNRVQQDLAQRKLEMQATQYNNSNRQAIFNDQLNLLKTQNDATYKNAMLGFRKQEVEAKNNKGMTTNQLAKFLLDANSKIATIRKNYERETPAGTKYIDEQGFNSDANVVAIKNLMGIFSGANAVADTSAGTTMATMPAPQNTTTQEADMHVGPYMNGVPNVVRPEVVSNQTLSTVNTNKPAANTNNPMVNGFKQRIKDYEGFSRDIAYSNPELAGILTRPEFLSKNVSNGTFKIAFDKNNNAYTPSTFASILSNKDTIIKDKDGNEIKINPLMYALNSAYTPEQKRKFGSKIINAVVNNDYTNAINDNLLFDSVALAQYNDKAIDNFVSAYNQKHPNAKITASIKGALKRYAAAARGEQIKIPNIKGIGETFAGMAGSGTNTMIGDYVRAVLPQFSWDSLGAMPSGITAQDYEKHLTRQIQSELANEDNHGISQTLVMLDAIGQGGIVNKHWYKKNTFIDSTDTFVDKLDQIKVNGKSLNIKNEIESIPGYTTIKERNTPSDRWGRRAGKDERTDIHIKNMKLVYDYMKENPDSNLTMLLDKAMEAYARDVSYGVEGFKKVKFKLNGDDVSIPKGLARRLYATLHMFANLAENRPED